MSTITDMLNGASPLAGLLNHTGGAHFTFYDTQTGRIAQVTSHTDGCPPDLALPGCTMIPGNANVWTDYVDLSGQTPAIRPRPKIDGLDALPIPAEVTVRCETTRTVDHYTVEDGRFDYDDAPGRYTVTVTAWPHLDATFELEL